MINRKFFLILAGLCFIGFNSVAQAPISTDLVARNDTTNSVAIKSSNVVRIVRNEDELILRRGSVLQVDLGESKELSQVRVHSSLGRLVKTFKNASNKVFMDTKKLLPGVYLIIIKRAESREIRKFILTE